MVSENVDEPLKESPKKLEDNVNVKDGEKEGVSVEKRKVMKTRYYSEGSTPLSAVAHFIKQIENETHGEWLNIEYQNEYGSKIAKKYFNKFGHMFELTYLCSEDTTKYDMYGLIIRRGEKYQAMVDVVARHEW